MARSAVAGSPWLATAAFSSVTWAKSRWLASATARITSVNLAARSRPALVFIIRSSEPSCVTL
jgi:hypothetical protein